MKEFLVSVVKLTASFVCGVYCSAYAQEQNAPDTSAPLPQKPTILAIYVPPSTAVSASAVKSLSSLLAAKLASTTLRTVESHDVLGEDFFKNNSAIDEVTADHVKKGDPPLVRVAQAIGANLIISAELTSFGSEAKTYAGSGKNGSSPLQVTESTLVATYKVLDANTGQSLLGDTAKAVNRTSKSEFFDSSNDRLEGALIESIADTIATSVKKGNITSLAPHDNDSKQTQFTITSNVLGGAVEIDGVTIGTSPGTFSASPGIHQIKVSQDFFAPWIRTVNITDGAKFNIEMQLSPEGAKRFKDITAFNKDYELRAKIVDANIENEKKLAEGEKARLENSYTRIEGDLKSLSIGSDSVHIMNGGK